MLLATALVLLSASPGPGLDWKRPASKIGSDCTAGLARARERVKAALAPDARGKAGPPPLERLIAVETAVAELNEAVGTIWVLTLAGEGPARGAATRAPVLLERHREPRALASEGHPD